MSKEYDYSSESYWLPALGNHLTVAECSYPVKDKKNILQEGNRIFDVNRKSEN